MSILFLPREKLYPWLAKLSKTYTIYYPDSLENKVHYNKLNQSLFDETDIRFHKTLQKIRPAESLKGFFFNPKLKVAGLEKTSIPDIFLDESPRIIIGAKNCDLRPLQVHQKMYLESEFGEPFYKAQFERTLIIAADCPVPEQTCFCNLLGLKPYPEQGMDIVVSVLPAGYIFETSSNKGEEFIATYDHLFQEVSTSDMSQREGKRNRAIALLDEINPKQWRKDLAKAIDKKTEEDFWQEGAKTCVECFGCLMVCPTCFCFLLYDTPIAENSFARYKIWDACYYAAYARVGGGMNPRPEFWKRFLNRFHCKFMNFYNDYGFNSCSGCGRCYSVCMGKIDIRKILEKL
jgi:ferredoxin